MAGNASVEIVDKNRLFFKLKNLSTNIENDKLILEKIGNFFVFSIKERTLKGKDIEENSFKPYSTTYKEMRSKKGLPTDTVDLFFSGAMHGAITYKVNHLAAEARVYVSHVSDSKGVKNSAKAFYLNDKREFFGISASDAKEVTKLVQSWISGLMK